MSRKSVGVGRVEEVLLPSPFTAFGAIARKGILYAPGGSVAGSGPLARIPQAYQKRIHQT